MRFKKPILAEVFSEVYSRETISPQIQFEIIEKIKDEYCIIESETDITSAPNLTTKYKMWNVDRKELFQIFHNRVAFNLVVEKKPEDYKGWEYYSQKALEVYTKVLPEFPQLKWYKIGLSYVNKIKEIKDKEFNLGKYIKCDGRYFPTYLSDKRVATDFIIGSGDVSIQNNAQIKLKLTVPNEDIYDIVFQPVFIEHLEKDFDFDLMPLILNDNHEKCKEFFMSTITEHTISKIMGGKNE